LTADVDVHGLARIKPFDRELLSEAWAQLEPSQRDILGRAHFLGWTTDRIAADLNVAESRVKAELHHALRFMRLTLMNLSTNHAVHEAS
jgi:RNA polymerase sigma-70 factor, ECF subfamily